MNIIQVKNAPNSERYHMFQCLKLENIQVTFDMLFLLQKGDNMF